MSKKANLPSLVPVPVSAAVPQAKEYRDASVKAASGTSASAGLKSNQGVYGKRELIFISEPAAPRAMGSFVSMDAAMEAFPAVANEGRSLAEILSAPGVNVTPLFSTGRRHMAGVDTFSPAAEGAFSSESYYHVDAADEQLDELVVSLRNSPEVRSAYIKPKGEPPVLSGNGSPAAGAPSINRMQPSILEPDATPDFTTRQIYLNAAPEGVDARYAWRFPGGMGQGVRIIDCEWAWRFTHEDLKDNQGGVVIGSASSDDNHGTSVLGEFSGDRNSFGITGICSEAFASAASFATTPTASVIRAAADKLRPGDIILLEIHRPGPDANGTGQDGFIAIEWWPDDFEAIRYAVDKGIVVVEAAGNGARNLDDPIFDDPIPGFPRTWKNPFNPANPSSGAILVGAGAPPPGTHGKNWGPDRSRLDFSNHGRRVDVQGWGREVTSTGYGDLQGGSNRDQWYTDEFSGTSSASPIVVGVLGCIQGILRARNLPPLSPDAARQLLRATGSPQQDGLAGPKTERIGNRPDLHQIIDRLIGVQPPTDSILAAGDTGSKNALNASNRKVVINIRAADVTINLLGNSSGSDHVEINS